MYLYGHMRTHDGQSNPVRNLEINVFKIILLNFLTNDIYVWTYAYNMVDNRIP